MAKKTHKKSHFRRRLTKRSSIKGSGMALLAGAATGFVAGKIAENVEFMRKAWYITPAAAAVAGHLAKAKWHHEIGQAVIGGAGVMTYYNYILARASQLASGGTQGVQETSGVQDTGALDYVAAMNALPETTGAGDLPRYAPSNVAGLEMG
jgi:hypothetical protein